MCSRGSSSALPRPKSCETAAFRLRADVFSWRRTAVDVHQCGCAPLAGSPPRPTGVVWRRPPSVPSVVAGKGIPSQRPLSARQVFHLVRLSHAPQLQSFRTGKTGNNLQRLSSAGICRLEGRRQQSIGRELRQLWTRQMHPLLLFCCGGLTKLPIVGPRGDFKSLTGGMRDI